MPAAERARLDAHLELCEGCVNYVAQMRQTIRAVGELDAEEVEATVPDDVLAAFRAWRRGDPVPEG
jgi:anti-sigma factor RsiW